MHYPPFFADLINLPTTNSFVSKYLYTEAFTQFTSLELKDVPGFVTQVSKAISDSFITIDRTISLCCIATIASCKSEPPPADGAEGAIEIDR